MVIWRPTASLSAHTAANLFYRLDQGMKSPFGLPSVRAGNRRRHINQYISPRPDNSTRKDTSKQKGGGQLSRADSTRPRDPIVPVQDRQKVGRPTGGTRTIPHSKSNAKVDSGFFAQKRHPPPRTGIAAAVSCRGMTVPVRAPAGSWHLGTWHVRFQAKNPKVPRCQDAKISRRGTWPPSFLTQNPDRQPARRPPAKNRTFGAPVQSATSPKYMYGALNAPGRTKTAFSGAPAPILSAPKAHHRAIGALKLAL
jgi:hypothetical protein